MLKSLPLCNKVLSYPLSVCLSVCLSLSVSLSVSLSLCVSLSLFLSLSLPLSLSLSLSLLVPGCGYSVLHEKTSVTSHNQSPLPVVPWLTVILSDNPSSADVDLAHGGWQNRQ